jgi:hypothetical protein
MRMSKIDGNTRAGEIDRITAGSLAPLMTGAKAMQVIAQPQRDNATRSRRDATAARNIVPPALEHSGADRTGASSGRQRTAVPPRASLQGMREDGAWTSAAVAAAWDREDAARAVAEIEDAAAALRWQDMDRAVPANDPWEVERSRQRRVWLGVGSMWASIVAATVGMLGGLALLMR